MDFERIIENFDKILEIQSYTFLKGFIPLLYLDNPGEDKYGVRVKPC